jgi:hypothetical protein
MRVFKLAATLATFSFTVLLMFPPGLEHAFPENAPALDSTRFAIGHQWRFSTPYYWGYESNYCSGENGSWRDCGGKSQWKPDGRAIVDDRMLRYQLLISAVMSVFLALMTDWIGRLWAKPVRTTEEQTE